MMSLQTPQKVTRKAGEKLETLAAEVGQRLRDKLQSVLPVRPTEPLPPAIDAERKTMRSHRGPVLSYYESRQGEGRPLVLIHGVHACASAYEMKPLFDKYRGVRPVYALDLSGFGFSERGALAYTPEAYAEELVDFLTRVKDKEGDAPDVVALSLSCEFLARAAVARKDLVHSLAFISPTGFAEEAPAAGPTAALKSSISETVSRAVADHWWSPFVYEAIVARPSIRYFLGRSFTGPVNEELSAYDYATAHQPGAEFAPLAFLSGGLFTPKVYDLYAALQRPTIILYDQDGYTRFDRVNDLTQHSALFSAKQIEGTRGLPQFERLAETIAALEEFWHAHAHHGRSN